MTPSIKRAIFISDLHFGVRSNSIDWVNIQEDYFNNFFFPFLEEHVRPEDHLFILGDVFDNRQSINLLVLNLALETISKLSKILPIHILVGNHDLYRKNSNDINSIKVFKNIDNVVLYEEPSVLDIDNKKVSIMPWMSTLELEKKYIENDTSGYLFCHTEIKGFSYNRKILAEGGNTKNLYSRYNRVFSGHIHFRQEKGNVVYLGPPYQLSRGDIDNIKGIYIFDFSDDSLNFYENRYSPFFYSVKFDDILVMKSKEKELLFKNNFVDVICKEQDINKKEFNKFLKEIDGYKKLNIITDTEEKMNVDFFLSENDLIEFDIKNFLEGYIDSMEYNEKMKVLIKKKVFTLYDKVLNTGASNEDIKG